MNNQLSEKYQAGVRESPPGPIDNALGMASMEVNALLEIVAKLRDRITPVLRPTGMGSASIGGNGAPTPVTSAMRSRIDVHVSGLADVKSQLMDLLDRVEL